MFDMIAFRRPCALVYDDSIRHGRNEATNQYAFASATTAKYHAGISLRSGKASGVEICGKAAKQTRS